MAQSALASPMPLEPPVTIQTFDMLVIIIIQLDHLPCEPLASHGDSRKLLRTPPWQGAYPIPSPRREKSPQQ